MGLRTTLDRTGNLLVRPKEEWKSIAVESQPFASLLKEVVIPLSLAGGVTKFIGLYFIYGEIALLKQGVSLFSYAIWGLFVYSIVAVLTILITPAFLNKLSRSFKSGENAGLMRKLVAYSMIPALLVNIVTHLHPVFSLLGLVGLYSFYLFYSGLDMLKTPDHKKIGFTIVAAISILGIYFILSIIMSGIASTMLLISA